MRRSSRRINRPNYAHLDKFGMESPNSSDESVDGVVPGEALADPGFGQGGGPEILSEILLT